MTSQISIHLLLTRFFLTLVTALLVVSAGFASPVYAQGSTEQYIDPRSPLSQDISRQLLGLCPYCTLDEVFGITKDVQVWAAEYEIEPSLILALMEGETIYPGNPQTRLYYFNLDMGAQADGAVFPDAWFDAERVARSYGVQFERYKDRTAAVAAYFVGSQGLAPDGDITNASDALRELVSHVLTKAAEWSHLGERTGPQIVQVTEETPETPFEQPEYDYTEIEQAYIDNMLYFNRNLDDQTAHEIFEAIRTHGQSYPNVDARLVMALVATESSFRPEAVSHSGAQGLGQLMPFTSERFGVEDPFDIDENIRATFAYLDREIERWKGSNYMLDRILAAYNAGAGAVERYSDAPYNGVPPYDETQNYVRIVVNRYYYFLPEEERAEKIGGGCSRYYDHLINGG